MHCFEMFFQLFIFIFIFILYFYIFLLSWNRYMPSETWDWPQQTSATLSAGERTYTYTVQKKD